MFDLDFAPPPAEEFIRLRNDIGWKNCTADLVQESINNSLFWVSVYENKTLVATGRVIGDGAMYFYIQDVIVAPEHQGKGLGDKIMLHIESFLRRNATQHATVGLMAAKGKEGFYQKYGYLLRDGQHLGLALCKFV